jgi:transcriptional regulator with XRE-family HTH domain
MEHKKTPQGAGSLGATIRAGRETAGLNLRDCAKLVGVHYSYLSRLESGEYDRTRTRNAATARRDARAGR